MHTQKSSDTAVFSQENGYAPVAAPPKPRVLGIVGPTASGKTAIALALARMLPCEVVSLDSMQIYRGMDIGTAKPTQAERAALPHHMLDIVPPDAAYSVADYVPAAHAAIQSILARGAIPLLVGGTGLYLKGLSLLLDYGGLPGDPAIREALKSEAESQGALALHQRLREVDPQSAQKLHPNDLRRVIRALEVFMLTGLPLSRHRPPDGAQSPYDFTLFALALPRNELHARINRRVDDMMARGLLCEVKGLMENGLSPDAQSMQGLGYRQLAPVVMGDAPLNKAVEDIKTGTRNYARRQETWFRGDSRVRWLPLRGAEEAAECVASAWKEHNI